MNNSSIIGIVEDESRQRKSLRRLLNYNGFQVCEYASAETCIVDLETSSLDCILLDLSMPGMGGFGLQERLREKGIKMPIIFLTGNGDIPSAVRAMQTGAANFLTKPVDETELVNALRLALRKSENTRRSHLENADLKKRFSLLTQREHEVLRHVVAGKLNKQIADDLGIRVHTIKVHRMRITEKTGIPSVAELARSAERLQIQPAH